MDSNTSKSKPGSIGTSAPYDSPKLPFGCIFNPNPPSMIPKTDSGISDNYIGKFGSGSGKGCLGGGLPGKK